MTLACDLLLLSQRAAKCFSQAGMYEAVNEVFKAALPIAENARNFKKLADIHGELHEAFKNVHRLQVKTFSDRKKRQD